MVCYGIFWSGQYGLSVLHTLFLFELPASLSHALAKFQCNLSLVSHALRACEARALRTRKTLTARFTDFFPDFEKKNRLFFSLT